MKFKILPNRLRKQTNNIINKNERLATNIVNPTPSSFFDKSFRHLTTFDSNKLVPIFVDECLPGDIFNIDVSTLIRLSIPNAATMENPVYDISFFFVPNRIIWENWKYFMGENKDAGYQKEYKTIPMVDYSGIPTTAGGIIYDENDLASYLGIPLNMFMHKINVPISSLYFKAYGKIWNDYYRDQNLQSEIDITNNNNIDDNVSLKKILDSNNFTYISDLRDNYEIGVQCGYGLAPVSRFPDYFSTCLPFPQKGENVNIDTLPLNNLILKLPSLKVNSIFNNEIGGTGQISKDLITPLQLYKGDGTVFRTSTDKNSSALYAENRISSGSAPNITQYPTGRVGATPSAHIKDGISEYAYLALNIPEQELSGVFENSTGFNYSINDLRLSIAIQQMRELDARGGTRYIEYLLNHFGIQTSDSRLDRAEMIGGFRDNINISNVVQSAPGSGFQELGSLGGVSITGGKNPRTIQYAVKEHGIIMGFITVRPQINYSQGLDKKFTRVEKLDFYEPLLANIGEQPVYKYELFMSDKDDNENNAIFGYNEPWADYRYSLNKLSGFMSVNSIRSLSSLYAYTEEYSNAPVLSAEWMYPSKDIIGNTLLFKGSGSDRSTEFIHQFLGDFYFNCKVERKMPVYSIPGLKRI